MQIFMLITSYFSVVCIHALSPDQGATNPSKIQRLPSLYETVLALKAFCLR